MKDPGRSHVDPTCERRARLRNGDAKKVCAIVLAGFAARALLLWAGRGEFTGWFNHTYYSFVQARGLLEQGRLPFPDMPLLFHLEALVARLLRALGLAGPPAIVAATRFWICLLPALVAVPVHRIVRRIHGDRSLGAAQWIVVATAALLPLSLVHLPEISPKNLLGLLLLAAIVAIAQRWLLERRWQQAAAAALLFVLVVASHFGTVAAALIFGAALVVAEAVVVGRPRRLLSGLAGLGAAVAASLALIRQFDPQRFQRIFEYLQGTVDRSLVGALFDPGRERLQVLLSLGAVLGFDLTLYAAHRYYVRHRPDAPPAERTFWLTNVLFALLLLLPVVDERLMSRLVVFLPLPGLVAFALLEAHALRGRRARGIALALLVTTVSVLTAGEIVGSRIRSRNEAAIAAELAELRVRLPLRPDDLVLTKSGAEHLCNWYFGVKAGMITSLRREDFASYGRVFVLNPIEGELALDGVAERRARTETDRYFFMRQNIPRPEGIEPLFRSAHLEFFRLDAPPPEWSFDGTGRWDGYSRAPATSERGSTVRDGPI